MLSYQTINKKAATSVILTSKFIIGIKPILSRFWADFVLTVALHIFKTVFWSQEREKSQRRGKKKCKWHTDDFKVKCPSVAH